MNTVFGGNVLTEKYDFLVSAGRLFLINEDSLINNGQTISVDVTTTKRTEITVSAKVGTGLATWEIIKDGIFSAGTEVVIFNPNLSSVISLTATAKKDATISGSPVVLLDGNIGSAGVGREGAEAGFPTKLVVSAGTFSFKLTSLVNGNNCTISLGLTEL